MDNSGIKKFKIQSTFRKLLKTAANEGGTVGIIHPYKPPGSSTQHLGHVLACLYRRPVLYQSSSSASSLTCAVTHGCDTMLYGSLLNFPLFDFVHCSLAVEFLVFFQLLISSRVSSYLSTAHQQQFLFSFNCSSQQQLLIILFTALSQQQSDQFFFCHWS